MLSVGSGGSPMKFSEHGKHKHLLQASLYSIFQCKDFSETRGGKKRHSNDNRDILELEEISESHLFFLHIFGGIYMFSSNCLYSQFGASIFSPILMVSLANGIHSDPSPFDDFV